MNSDTEPIEVADVIENDTRYFAVLTLQSPAYLIRLRKECISDSEVKYRRVLTYLPGESTFGMYLKIFSDTEAPSIRTITRTHSNFSPQCNIHPKLHQYLNHIKNSRGSK
jgi:hypothetical protein